MELELKEGEPLVRHSRQTLHSRNLTLGVLQQHNTFHFHIFQITGNEIGDEGWRAIAEALKTNTSLTKLDLGMIQHYHFSFSHLPNHRQ